MADKLIFPIGFDLEAAVKKAESDWEGKYAARLEKSIQKRALELKFKVGDISFTKLEDVKRRLGQLKIEPVTPETKAAIRELVRELKGLARIMERLQKFKGIEMPELQMAKAAKLRKEVEQANEKLRLSQERVRQAEERLILSQKRAEQQAYKTGKAYQSMDGYISRLIKRLAVYAGFMQIKNFLTSVREVTAEFELQRVSLGAIIQDQTRANQLFSEIKSFALSSPVSILDLTKYTKQLAAYKIGVDELFETTKKLTDVSVGLGVSMDRVILAYGQTRATGYLRASEIRQFTEMGVPIVEELANKLSQMNGELVTAAQVMDMVSKRAISFELVKEVFDDMTSAGGMFYNMQEKQGNTLYGMWAKLGDAASVMYDEIGNTDSVNSAMKTTIGLLTDLMRNWRSWAKTIALAGGVFGVASAAMYIYTSAVKANTIAMKANALASIKMRMETIKGNTALTIGYKTLRLFGLGINKATAYTIAFSKAIRLIGTISFGAVIAGLTWLAEKALQAHENANRLKNTLADMTSENERETAETVNKFKILADRAVEAADGSKAQKNALDELKNTYGQIIPYEYLTIENLKQMKGEYGELTTMIEEYNAKLALTNKQNAIIEDYTAKEKESRSTLRDLLKEKGVKIDTGENVFVQEIKFNPVTIQKFFDELDEITKTTTDKSLAISKALAAIWGDLNLGPLHDETGELSKNFKLVNEAMLDFDRGEWESQGTLMDYVEALIEKNQLLQQEQDLYDRAAAKLNEYTAIVDELQNKIKEKGEITFSSDESYSAYLENEKAKIQDIYQAIVEVINKETPEIIEGNNKLIKELNSGAITYSQFLDKLLDLPLSAKAHAAVKSIQKIYSQLAPTDRTVIVFREKFQALANTMGVSMFKVQKSLMQQGQTLEEHRKVISDEIDEINKKIISLVATKSLMASFGYDVSDIEKQIEAEKRALDFYNKYLGSIPSFSNKGSKGGGKKSDDRLSQLKEIESSLSAINSKYDELVKKEGKTAALDYVNKNYKESLALVNKLAAKYKLAFEMPTDFKDLQSYRKQIADVIRKLKMKGYEKAAVELELKIAEGNQKKLEEEIEKRLKETADRISRTKTAKEFYDRILSQTGDAEIAATLTMNVYGEGGEDLFNNTVKLLQEYFSGVEVDLPINLETQQIDYKALRKIWEADKALPKDMRKIPEAYDSAIKQMLDSADSATQKMIEGWRKATEKAKTYGDKLADVYRTTATEIKRIEKESASTQLELANLLEIEAPTEEQQKRIESLRDMLGVYSDLINDFKAKQAKEETALAYEAFKDSPMYVQLFDDLGSASTTMLNAMRDRLVQLKGEWKNLDPTQLKEMQQRLREIDEQLTSHNPFKALIASLKQYRKLRTKGDNLGSKSTAEADEKLLKATEKRIEAEERYKAILKDVNATKEQKDKAKADFEKAESDEKAAQKAKEVWQDVSITIGSATDTILAGLGAIGDIANGVADIMESLGAEEEDVTYWRTIGDSMSQITAGLQDVVQSIMKGDLMGVITGIITAIPKMFVGFSSLFSAGKVRKANKEIKRQKELLEQLEYAYGRLEAIADKVFGSDYISNYNQQLRNLQAQATAYQKQYEAEKSKGKKADKDKLKDYENAYRDTMDKIADMRGKVAEQMTGTDLASAARDFAKSWLEAYISFGNTLDAMGEKFREMIQNMVVESLMAKVVEARLRPMFDQIDKLAEDGELSAKDIARVMSGVPAAVKDIDEGLKTTVAQLQAAGLSVASLGSGGSDLKGISREIAGASEESITGLAAMINTQNYYISHVPRIGEDVAAIRASLEQSGGIRGTEASADAYWNRHLELQQGIYRHTEAIAERAERAAVAAERTADSLAAVIKPRGASSSKVVMTN